MPEEQVVNTETVSTETAATTVTDSYINPDGTFKDGWVDHHVPAEVHNRNKMLWSGMRSVNDLVTQINNQDVAISRQGKGVFPPGENANELEIRNFHKQFSFT